MVSIVRPKTPEIPIMTNVCYKIMVFYRAISLVVEQGTPNALAGVRFPHRPLMNPEIFFLKKPRKAFLYAIKGKMGSVGFMYFCIIAGNVLAYSDTYLLKIIIDKISAGNVHSLKDILSLLILTGAVLLFSELFFRIGHFLEISVVLHAFDRITSYLYTTLLERPTAYFEDKFSGELSRRVEQIGEAIKFFIEFFPWELGWPIIGSVMTAVLLSTVHPLLFWTFIIWLVLFVGTSYVLLKLQYKYSEKVSEKNARLSGTIVDVFGNVSTVHTFAAHTYENVYYRKYMDETIRADRASRTMFLLNKVQQGMGIVILSGALIFIGIDLFLKNSITAGSFIIIAGVLSGFPGIVWTIGETVTRAITNLGEFKNALETLGAETSEVVNGAENLHDKQAPLHFKDVTFHYPNTQEKVLEHFELLIQPGQKVGLVGKSGAGKSTIVKLLLRSYDPTEGHVLVGAQDLRSLNVLSLREYITFVPQDTSLFHRSLYENILYAKPEATKEDVIEASKKAHAHDFIQEYPETYDTLVGERGVKLSGGQRQRIALARAMLKNSPFLVLDEATSSLDTQSEEIVQTGLQELFKDRTVLAIAHRLSTLRSMDRIIVLDNGRIVEDGSPQELLTKTGGVFKDMWERQKNGFV